MKIDPSKRKFWQTHLKTQAESGLSILRYCEQHDLKLHQFRYYKRQAQKRSPPPQSTGNFVPVTVQSSKPIMVELKSGHRISFSGPIDSDWLASLIKALEA